MTNREFFEAVMKIEGISEELKTFAYDGIAKLDKRNADRKAKPSKTAIADEPIKADIVALLEHTNTVLIASKIASELHISIQKASALCKQLANNGKIKSEEVKVKGKGKVKGYSTLD